MTNVSTLIVAFSSVIVLCGVACGQEAKYCDSFEDGLPDYLMASRADSLSISQRHSKQGQHSLRWDWSAGEELVIYDGIGDVGRVSGSQRASFSVWLYVEEPMPDALVFEFREGEKVTGSFRFPLEFTGWRQGRPFYHDFPSGQPTSQVDNIRIAAPTGLAKGTVFLDFIKYNTLTHPGRDVVPEIEARWRRPVPDEQRFPRPEQVTEAELAAIRSLLGPDTGPGIDQARVTELCEQVEALGIIREEYGVRGGPSIDGHLQYSGAHGYQPDEHGPGWMGMETPKALSNLALEIAKAYRASSDEAQRRRLADAFLLIADHLHDQALQAGSGFRWSWWYGGQWADAAFLMYEVLKETGRLQPHLDYLLYAWGEGQTAGGAIFVEGEAKSTMDFYNLTVPRLLNQCLMQPEPAEQVRWLRAFKAMLEQSILQPTSAFKVDGSAYHHEGHYYHYAIGAFHNLPLLFQKLSCTPWRLSAEAHERLRRAMLAQRIYANKYDLPLSLAGRKPFAASGSDIRRCGAGLDMLARLGTADGAQEIDPQVAAAYLRLFPEAAEQEPYRSLGIAPERDPNGTFVMPYAALLCHRRGNWLAAVKGQSRYIWGTERGGDNPYGLFQGLGSLEILAGGNPVSAEASGRQHLGWDWRRFEGTTVPQLPLEEVKRGGTSSSREHSPEPFVGGLSHRGRQGIFAMILDQQIMPETTMTGRKSWFFNDDQILCLGSDISCNESQYPTQTTLCQRALRADEQGRFAATLLNGAPFTAFPAQQVFDRADSHWFIDVQQTGYWLPAGQKVTVARQLQTSRDVYDSKDTEGSFLTAWIDHGAAADGAGYEYMVVIRSTPAEMTSLAAQPPYRVLQRDQSAHIVWHNAARRWGCVLFVPQQLAAHTVGGETLPVKAVDRPCLVMAEMVPDGQLRLSVADPDLNADPPTGYGLVSRPQTLRVTLRGSWRLVDVKETLCAWDMEDAADRVRIVSADADETVLEIICQHGASYEVGLSR